MNTNLDNFSHKRRNILTDEWVLVSPHRAKRPWQGQEEEIATPQKKSYDENCYLCATNTRITGDVNPDYKDVFVFKNDFAALNTEAKPFTVNNNLLQAESEQGICKVVCFSPDHSKSLADMTVKNIEKVVKVWQKEFTELGSLETINYVQIFENKGAVMGCSNPHPHGQIWSQSSIPNEVFKKDNQQKKYFNEKKSSLLGDYLQQEITAKERIAYENDSFLVLVPFWAVWPFETMIIPKKHQKDINEMSENDVHLFADAISNITRKYDKLFHCSFPYSSGIHQAPTNGKPNEYWHWHMSFYPPLLRSATVKKFMVGYEMFATPQRDITAESAAKILQKL